MLGLTLLFASEKHTVNKKRTKKIKENKYKYSYCVLLQPCVTFIKCLLYPLSVHFSLARGQM